jgi:hypothetical protein
MDSNSNKGYWKRQLYMLSSLGLFYVILIALFAVPLVATCVVILIKGALDLRYFIIAGGLLGLAILAIFTIRALNKLWRQFVKDGFKTGEMVRRHPFTGQPVEISILGGLLKFTTGQLHPAEPLSLPHRRPSPLPYGKDRHAHTDIVYQLQGLSELKRTGTIDSDEFNMLKGVLIETSTSASMLNQKNSEMLEKTLENRPCDSR